MAVKHLPSGKWQADHWKRDTEGKWRRYRKSFNTKNEAKAWESNRRSANKPRSTDNETRSIRFIDEAIEYYYTTAEFLKCEALTQNQYKLQLEQFRVWCETQGIYSLNDFKKDAARKYVAHIVKRYRGHSIDKRLRLVKTIINYELDRDNPVIGKNPFWKIKTSGYAEQGDPQFLTRETIDWVLERAIDRERAAIQILYNTGIRSAELHRMEWRQVENDRIILLASKTKTGKSRAVPLNKAAKEGFEYFRAITGKKRYVLHGNRPAHRTYLQKLLERMMKRLSKFENAPDLEHFTPHALRRSLASHALQRGSRIEDVSGVLGHKDISITKRSYATLIIDNLKDVVNRLDT